MVPLDVHHIGHRLRHGLHRRAVLCLALAAVALAPVSATAQGLGVDYAFNGAPMASFIAGSYLHRSIIQSNAEKMAQEARGRGSMRPAAAPAAPGVTLAPGPGDPMTTLREMATRAPAAQRPQLEKAFRESYAGWVRLEARLGLPRDDVAAAMAAFLAGNYMAFHGRAIPDEHFKTTVRQVRSLLAGNADFRRTDAAHKRLMYEQLATVGMFMAVAQLEFQQRPDPRGQARLRDAARSLLEQFLKMPADRLQITASGLSLG